MTDPGAGGAPAGPPAEIPPPVSVIRVPDPQLLPTAAVQGTLGFQVFGRELVRALLALAALALIFVTVIMAYHATATGARWTSAKEWLQAVLPAETAILGSAIGFYFGTQQGEQRAARSGSGSSSAVGGRAGHSS